MPTPTPLTPVAVGHTAPVALPAAAGGTAMDTNGNTVINGGETLLLIYNGDSSSHTVTVTFAATTNLDGQAVTPLGPFTLAATTEYALKLGSPTIYGNPALVTSNSALVKVRALVM